MALSFLKRSGILLLLLFMVSCMTNGDRDNPLDPKSDRYKNCGSLTGHVYTYYAPFQPIVAAIIHLTPGFYTTITDSKGAFTLLDIAPGNYLVTVSYPGYAPDTAQVEIQSHRITTIQFNLDGLPQLESLILNAGYYHEHYPFAPVRLIDITAKINDSDGPADVVSVAVIIPFLSFRDTLSFSSVIGTFQKKIKERELSVSHIAGLIGQPIYIEISDKAGQVCRYGPNYLFRVIDTEPVIVSPKGSASIGFQPTLKWNPVQLPFSFTFKVEIYVIQENQILFPAMYTFSGVSSEITELRLATVLPPSLYLWVVSIVDQWGNWSRSKPATFQVEG